MASKLFKKVVDSMDLSKNLETLLVGSNYLDDTTPHDVTIIGVDTSKLEDNKLDVIFADAEGKQHRESLFVTGNEEKGEKWSFGFRWLLTGCIPNDAAMKVFFETAAEDERILEAFTGMKMRITLSYGKGIKAHALANGNFVGFDPLEADELGNPIPQTAEYATLKEVWNEIKATGKKRAYLRIQRIESTEHKNDNLAAFATAVAALTSAKPDRENIPF